MDIDIWYKRMQSDEEQKAYIDSFIQSVDAAAMLDTMTEPSETHMADDDDLKVMENMFPAAPMTIEAAPMTIEAAPAVEDKSTTKRKHDDTMAPGAALEGRSWSGQVADSMVGLKRLNVPEAIRKLAHTSAIESHIGKHPEVSEADAVKRVDTQMKKPRLGGGSRIKHSKTRKSINKRKSPKTLKKRRKRKKQVKTIKRNYKRKKKSVLKKKKPSQKFKRTQKRIRKKISKKRSNK